MPSPRRTSSRSPPKRAALHERSDSHNNERSLRLVGEPQAPHYGKAPYPTKPQHILSPNMYSGQGSAEGAESDVSSETRSVIEDAPIVATSQNRIDRPDVEQNENAPTTTRSSTNASFYTPQTLTPGMDTSTSFLDDRPSNDSGRVSDDIVQLPSVPPRAESSRPQSTSNPYDPSSRQPVATKESDSSLSSTNSTGTVIIKKHRHGGRRASYSAFPPLARPSSSKSNLSLSTPQKAALKDPDEQSSPVSPMSPESPEFAAPRERRISSVPTYPNLQATSGSAPNLQYPVIRPPSASASWGEPPTSSHSRPPRVPERNPDRWNPHLSTVQSVHSEGTGSSSEGRRSKNLGPPDSTRQSKSSATGGNAGESSDLHALPSPLGESSHTPPLPSPPPVHRRDFTGSTIRVVHEREDRAMDLPATIPGSRGSEYLGASRLEHRNSVVTRPSSRASFFRDSIPAWAKAYYARPTSSASLPLSRRGSRPSTSESFSFNIFRPRNRREAESGQFRRRDSMAIEQVRRPSQLDMAGIIGPPLQRTPSWSPHLWHDRSSLGRRRTLFIVPSVDERAEGRALNKRNIQIVLFAVGYILPPAWFIASFLPLPPKSVDPNVKGKNVAPRTQLEEDLEKQLSPIDAARYENARWWRNINRILSAFGILIIIAIIALAVVAAK